MIGFICSSIMVGSTETSLGIIKHSGELYVGMEANPKIVKIGNKIQKCFRYLVQFQLFLAFSTWLPDEDSADLNVLFSPITQLVTGYDIIFFWLVPHMMIFNC